MQSLCTLTTSSDTFCTAVNKKQKINANTAGRWGGARGGVGHFVGEFGGKEEVR